MYEDDPQDRVFDVLGGAIFGSHPLGRAVIGSASVISVATREQLVDYHARRYLPASIVIAAAGSVDHDALVEMAGVIEPASILAKEAGASSSSTAGAGGAAGDMGDVGAGSATSDAVSPGANGAAPPRTGPGRNAARAPAPEFARRVRFLAKDTEQYHVCVGGPGIARDDPRRFALRVLEGVLGGTSSSRLFQEVRERRGLAYSVFSFSNLYADTGEVGVYVGTRPENLEQALSVISEELERCVENPADEEELTRSRENLKGRVVLSMESTAARMGLLGGSMLHGLPILSVDELIERIDAVGVSELRDLAAELFKPGVLSVAGVGPDEDTFRAAAAPLTGEASADTEPPSEAPGPLGAEQAG
jgi:predicted Zn-dependent peptidase